MDETGDDAFYTQPRFVTHIDDGAEPRASDVQGAFGLGTGDVIGRRERLMRGRVDLTDFRELREHRQFTGGWLWC